jgi:predicted outer membrane protein
MHHRPSGSRLSVLLLRVWRLRGRRPRLLVPPVVVLVASATVLTVAPRTGAVDGFPALDAVAAAAPATLAHEASATGAGIGAPGQADGQTAPGAAPSAAAISDADAGDAEKAATRGESLGPADHDVLFRVKQAGLWEMPVGTWAKDRAQTPRLREVGAKIAAEHRELDEIVNAAAAELGVELPADPTDEQQGWMREIDAQRGAEFDDRAVFLLRQAHGKVLPVLAQVRAGTRNAVIRGFTTEATTFVQRHIQYLESTGLVKFEQLPEPPAPGQLPVPTQASATTTHNWLGHAINAAVFVLFTAFFTAVFILLIQSVAGWRKGSAKTPRPTGSGRHTGR